MNKLHLHSYGVFLFLFRKEYYKLCNDAKDLRTLPWPTGRIQNLTLLWIIRILPFSFAHSDDHFFRFFADSKYFWTPLINYSIHPLLSLLYTWIRVLPTGIKQLRVMTYCWVANSLEKLFTRRVCFLGKKVNARHYYFMFSQFEINKNIGMFTLLHLKFNIQQLSHRLGAIR